MTFSWELYLLDKDNGAIGCKRSEQLLELLSCISLGFR
jgi:hypothetical protein